MIQAVREAAKAGRQTVEAKMDSRLEITGVGNGSQYCDYSMQIPIAVPTTDAEGENTNEAIEMMIDAPCVEGTGEQLPMN